MIHVVYRITVNHKTSVNMETQTRPCPTCRGTGTVPLSSADETTLAKLKRLTTGGKYVVATRDANKFGLTAGALANRLSRLERNGHARSEYIDRERRYTAI